MAQVSKVNRDITVDEILTTLDNSNKDTYNFFVSLGEPYSYLIDVRLNVFRSDNGQWAIAVERLGYNPRGGSVILDIYYYGNCILPLESFGNPTNSYSVLLIDVNSFESTVNDNEAITATAKFWMVRNEPVLLSHNKKEYIAAGIELKEYEPGEIRIEEAARLAILNYSEPFRATDAELYKAIPANLKKILVMDKWYHKDFIVQYTNNFTDEQIKIAYDLNKKAGGFAGDSFEDFKTILLNNQIEIERDNKESWDNNQPGGYETWQQLAKVIATNNISHYKPTLLPNTHWKNWPESGSL